MPHCKLSPRSSRVLWFNNNYYCSWAAVDGVGDESPFVASMRSHLRQAIPQLRDQLSDRRKYFAHLCLKLATQLSHKFVGALLRCKPVSLHGILLYLKF